MTAVSSDPLPRVGSRVTLRRLSGADLSHFQAYRHDAEVGRYQHWTPQADSEALVFLEEMSRIALFRSGEWAQLGIAEMSTNLLIGDIGVCVDESGEKAELGFTLSAQSQGRGLGTEAVELAIKLVFESTAVVQIVCITDERNTRSIRLLERVGMQRIATERSEFRGAPCVEHVYAVARQLRS